MAKIWIIGGTVETYIIAESLLKNKKDIIITVATDYGYEEFSVFKKNLVKASMDEEQMITFCKENDISIIADVSHPYAKEVTKNAVNASKILGIRYFRYERKNTDKDYNYDKIYYVDSHEDAIAFIKEKQFSRVLLTTGVKNVMDYISFGTQNLFVRILPRSEHIKSLEDVGFLSRNIIGMQGPFSIEMNKATINYTKADVLITKQSGQAGGYDEKIRACIDMGISIVVIKRPDVHCDNKYSGIQELISKILTI